MLSGSARHVGRSGRYYRVCGPDWYDPSDTTYSKSNGGRWNVPGVFGALYLNENLEGARANARRWLELNFGAGTLPEDIAEAFLPDVATFQIESRVFVDAVTDAGRRALGLAPHYATGKGYERCRKVGARLYAAKESGIATRSAVTAQSEELVVFDRVVKRIATPGARRRFADWFRPVG